MEFFVTRCPWYIAGPLIGLAVVALLGLANRPLGATGGWIDLVAFLRLPSGGLRWTVFFLGGIVLGGALSALAGGGFHDRDVYVLLDQRFGTQPGTRAALLVVAGAVMGYGVRTAKGCTSGHGICGTALGSRASWVSTAIFMVVAIATANLLAWIGSTGR
jgi:uncharacterized membrane protein YedE/YeeE